MTVTSISLLLLVFVSLTAIWVVARRPQRGHTPTAILLGFLAFVGFPTVMIVLGTTHQLDQAKKTDFCLSCHEMTPYGKSLVFEDLDLLPAGHYQNNRIPRDRACYSCHTTYTMFGGVEAKMKGAQHLFRHFTRDPSEPIELYDPFKNRECLHCHDGARSFEDSFGHDGVLAELRDESISCLDCHESDHLAATKVEAP
jgi:nitrate/TMAO reductase-like tetraheme cytochrome c subunit